MKIRVSASAEVSAKSDLVFGLAFEGKTPQLGSSLQGAVKAAKATGDLAPAFRRVSVFYPRREAGVRRLGFVGMGAVGDVSTDRLRRAAALAQQRAEQLGVREFGIVVGAADHKKIGAEAAGVAVAEGLVLGAYRFEPKRKEKPKPRKGQAAVVYYRGAAGDGKAFRAGFTRGKSTGEGTAFARDLGNRPGNECTPTYLASQAKKLAGTGLSVKVLEERDMKRLGMGALLGVSRGSVQPAKLIVLDAKPSRGAAKRTVCVVGKGLTFDSGGISIKPSAKMDEMRYDMCGGAAVMGLFHAIKNGALRGGRTRVVGVIAASENMPDADAQKPGDVVTACDGTTIEVLNTDAEGRLILADALAYAVKTYKPAMMVDLATLTGAVVVALGHEMFGVMGDDTVAEAVIAAAAEVDDPGWRLPLWDVHKEQIKSQFADIANLNSPAHGNGSTAGGAFLSRFVGDVPWAHLDIAGSAWGGRAKDYYRGGASGSGVRPLVQWIRGLD